MTKIRCKNFVAWHSHATSKNIIKLKSAHSFIVRVDGPKLFFTLAPDSFNFFFHDHFTSCSGFAVCRRKCKKRRGVNTEITAPLSKTRKRSKSPGRRIRTGKPSYSEVKLATTARLQVIGKVPHRLSSGDRRLSHEEAEANRNTSGCTGGTTHLDLLDEGGQHEQESAKFNRVNGPFNSVQKWRNF